MDTTRFNGFRQKTERELRAHRAGRAEGERLRRTRVKLGYPRLVFAEALGIDLKTLERWEEAPRLSRRSLEKLAAFGLDCARLVSVRNAPPVDAERRNGRRRA